MNDILRVAALSIFVIYSIWLLFNFISKRSSAKESALHTASVFLSVSLMVQGVYTTNSGPGSSAMFLLLGAGCAGVCYYVLINRSREASTVSVKDDSVSISVIGQEPFNAEVSELRSAEISNEILEIKYSGDQVQKIDLSLFEDLDDLAAFLGTISDDLSSSVE